jgi:large subunit ribosomal protein L17
VRHGDKTKKVGRGPEHRRSLKRNLSRISCREEQVKTTEAKADFVQPFVEKLVTRAAEDSVHNRRQAQNKLGASSDTDEAVRKLFEELGPRFDDRPGGYTRILKLDRRKGDGASRVLIEFVEEE